MSLPIEFHPGVRHDVLHAYRWYEERRGGLGTRFLNAVQRTLKEIERNPAAFDFGDTEVREGKVKRFPFVVHYQVLSDCIRIISVFHTSRDPSEWQTRL